MLDGARIASAAAIDIDPAKRRELRSFPIFSPLRAPLEQREPNPERCRGVEEQLDRVRFKLDVN